MVKLLHNPMPSWYFHIQHKLLCDPGGRPETYIYREIFIGCFNSMLSLQILSKYPVDGGFLPLMDCIPNQTHRAAVNKLKCGSFNTKIKIGCLVQWGKRTVNLPILQLQLLWRWRTYLSQMLSLWLHKEISSARDSQMSSRGLGWIPICFWLRFVL